MKIKKTIIHMGFSVIIGLALSSCNLDINGLVSEFLNDIRDVTIDSSGEIPETEVPKNYDENEVDESERGSIRIGFKENLRPITDVYDGLKVTYYYEQINFTLTFTNNPSKVEDESTEYRYYWTVSDDRDYAVKVDISRNRILVPYPNGVRPLRIKINFF